jgi:Rhamnan synthesis protein F
MSLLKDIITANLPPRWKVQREWKRLKSQSSRGIRNLYEPFIQRYHDAHFAERVKVHSGRGVATARVAIFLLWQSGALPSSLRLTLAKLKQAGFCTVVVSNATLTSDTRDTLLQACVAVLERPNFGYDFGGYRDGVRFVRESLPDIDTLLIINDSTWFPLRASDSTLEWFLDDPHPYKGLVNKQVVHKRSQRKHLESHFLMFEKPVLMHPSFETFWRKYPVSSDRYNTIRRGEYGISTAVLEAGFPMMGRIDPWKFVDCISSLSPVEVRDVLENAVLVSPARIGEVATAVEQYSNTLSWRDRAASLISEQVWREEHLITTAYIYAGLRFLDFPYLKKRREPLVTVTRVKAIEAVDKGIIAPFDPSVDAEVRQTL